MIQNTLPAIFLGSALFAVSTSVTADEWDIIIGYRFVDLDHQYEHDTHPNDSFLPGATTPGSAGTTHLDSSHWISVGGRYQTLTSGLNLNMDVAMLLSLTRDEKKNDNDNRPNPTAAFIYSKANLGGVASLGINFDRGSYILGIETQLMAIYIEDGWDRFDKDKKKHSELKINSSIGPKFIYRFEESMGLEATLQMGNPSYGAVNLVWGL